jgi:hypothetical protein
MTNLEKELFEKGKLAAVSGKGCGAQYSGTLRQAWSYGKLCGLAERGAILAASQCDWLGFYEEKFAS